MAAGVKRVLITKNIDEEHLLTLLTGSVRIGIGAKDVSQWILLDSAQLMRFFKEKKMFENNFFQQIYSVFFDTSTKSFVCSSTNTDCQQMACDCDAAFVNSIVFSLTEFNSYYANSHGWQPSTQCTPNPFSRGPPDQCCGTYPTRYPYNSEDGARGCCNGHTFNSLTHECCNTVLLAAGSCPMTTTPAPSPCVPDPCQNGTCMDTSADTGISGIVFDNETV
jgi:hypothetical protein